MSLRSIVLAIALVWLLPGAVLADSHEAGASEATDLSVAETAPVDGADNEMPAGASADAQDATATTLPEPNALEETGTATGGLDAAGAAGTDGASPAELAEGNESAALDGAPPAAPADDQAPSPAADLGSSDDLAWGGATEAAAEEGKGVKLGPLGYDADGRAGRLHTVAGGDTLWDISAAYLGTPWVWPSVWHENENIENPHVISPGDLLWITSSEIRRVTQQEADVLVSGEPAGDESLIAETGEFDPSLQDGDLGAGEAEAVEIAAPAALDQLPVSVPLQGSILEETGRRVRVSSREGMSFVSSEELAAASSIVGSPVDRKWLAGQDPIYLGLGEGEAEIGDQYTIYRDIEEVRDIDGGLLGYHVKVLGWAEVRKVSGDTSSAEIRLAVSEIELGDRIIRRQAPDLEIAVREAPTDLDGHIIYLPDERTHMGSVDYVYLNRGSIHGIEVGSEIQVYDPSAVTVDTARDTEVQTPQHDAASLIVVSVKPESCVAYVTHARRELEVGDLIRSAMTEVASAR